MRPIVIDIDKIYIPLALRKQPVDAEKVQAIAENIAEAGLQTPISVREDVDRYVLVSGLHRLEACKALGEKTIAVYIVQARKF